MRLPILLLLFSSPLLLAEQSACSSVSGDKPVCCPADAQASFHGWKVLQGVAQMETQGDDSRLIIPAQPEEGAVVLDLTADFNDGEGVYGFCVKGVSASGNLVSWKGHWIMMFSESSEIRVQIYQASGVGVGQWRDIGTVALDSEGAGWLKFAIVEEGSTWSLLIDDEIYAEGMSVDSSVGAKERQLAVYGSSEEALYLDFLAFRG